jgi:hypothetical protein
MALIHWNAAVVQGWVLVGTYWAPASGELSLLRMVGSGPGIFLCVLMGH